MARRCVPTEAPPRLLHTSVLRHSAWAVPTGRAPPVAATDLQQAMAARTPIVCMTAFDAPTALAARPAGTDICLVGDSLANVALGYSSTRALSLDAMIHHARTVRAAAHAPELQFDANCPRAPMVIVDMPFGTVIGSVDEAVRRVVRVVHETQAFGVKMEGSLELLPLIEHLSSHGIAVMGHIGLQPQRYGDASGFRVQGGTAPSAMAILETAQALERAGCFSFVLECVPARVGAAISERVGIPVIGIGAGPHTHGQVLVCTDILGDVVSPAHVSAVLAGERAQPAGAAVDGATAVPVDGPAPPVDWPVPPKFVRTFGTNFGAQRIAALRAFANAVRARSFPDDAESYKMKRDEWAALQQRLDTM